MPPTDAYQPQPYVKLTHPAWSRDAVIYQINTRQFTPQGTFQAAIDHLPRLKDLGVDILWLMPIHEIGIKNRKGPLGSPYAVRDYYSASAELGGLDQFRQFLGAAHDHGFFVILDWVANHTAWDNVLVTEHPEWYTRGWDGEFRSTPWVDWEDVIDLDYAQPGLREYMTAAMKHWVAEIGVDGFRCDVAGFVPNDFWANVRRELEAVKPVFLLAEWEERDIHAKAFDMSYAWSWHSALHQICVGKADLRALLPYYSHNYNAFPADVMRMLFVSNHDKNAWEGTQFELFGDGLHAAIVLSVISEGMPLLYNGQEAGNPKRLAFFEKDPIKWRQHPIADLYTKLFALKKANSALHNAAWGARMIPVPNSAPHQVLSFVRQNEHHKVFAIFNFSAVRQPVTFRENLFPGSYTEFFSGKTVTLEKDSQLELPAWGYHVYLA